MTDKPLPRRAREILDALNAVEGYLDRNQLADATGKRRLSQNDLILLERLESAGLIESEKRAGKSPVGFQYVYRIKQAG